MPEVCGNSAVEKPSCAGLVLAQSKSPVADIQTTGLEVNTNCNNPILRQKEYHEMENNPPASFSNR